MNTRLCLFKNFPILLEAFKLINEFGLTIEQKKKAIKDFYFSISLFFSHDYVIFEDSVTINNSELEVYLACIFQDVLNKNSSEVYIHKFTTFWYDNLESLVDCKIPYIFQLVECLKYPESKYHIERDYYGNIMYDISYGYLFDKYYILDNYMVGDEDFINNLYEITNDVRFTHHNAIHKWKNIKDDLQTEIEIIKEIIK